MTVRTVIIASVCTAFLGACTQTPSHTAAAFASERVVCGKTIYGQECAQCHGIAGEGGGPAALGLGAAPPDLVGLNMRNGGQFPRAFVRQYVLGLTVENDLAGPMPDFARVGLRHVHPKGGADGEVLEADFESLLDYLETIQE
ncbi:c-type cytochrome [Ascidiaceihabitans sp.]|uniref:c-type cytochrome n=1 Tax=Ascidiaceihabitans sp. TaxID=1872644 RepID=UPI0032996248